jgi:hypothetical protein
MKRILPLIILLTLSACRPEPEKCCGDETFKKHQDQIAEEIYNWEVYKDSLYILSDSNTDSALILLQTHLDSLAKAPHRGSAYDHYLTVEEKLSDLHFMKGELLYKCSNFEKALIEFSFTKDDDFSRAKKITQERIVRLNAHTNEIKSLHPLPTRRVDYIKEFKKLNGL